MFLDVAVLDNCDPQMPPYHLDIWKASWKTGIDGSTIASCLRNLEDRCFTETTVQIHEQIRDMAKSMSRPPEMKIELCRTVWLPRDIDHLLQAFIGEQAHTEILSVPKMTVEQSLVHTTFPREYRWSSIGQLRELRFLRISNVRLVDNNAQRFPSKLAFLHLTSCCRGPTTKFWFLESDNWPLREEDINFHRLMKLPREFGRLPGLESLLLDNIGISKLPDSFLQLSSLQACTLRRHGPSPNKSVWKKIYQVPCVD